MNLLESPERHFPTSWNEMSFDFKGMFLYFGCSGLLWIMGGSLSIKILVFVMIVLVMAWISVSGYNRKRRKWRWPGASVRNLLQVVLALILGGVFLFAISPVWSFMNAPAWYIGVCGIIVFNVLYYLNLVDLSEQDFQNKCGGKTQSISKNRSDLLITKAENWENTVKIIFSVFFIVVWIEFMLFMYYVSVTYNNGSPVPTMYQTEALTQHSRTVYITSSEKIVLTILQIFAFIGMPSAVISGFFLQKKGLYPGMNRKLNISNFRQKKRG